MVTKPILGGIVLAIVAAVLAGQSPIAASLAGVAAGVLVIAAVRTHIQQAQHKKLQAQYNRRRDHALDGLVTRLATEHARTLLMKREQLSVADPYGNVDYNTFLEHLDYFIENVIFRDFQELGFDPAPIASDLQRMWGIKLKVVQIIDEYSFKRPTFNLSDVKTGEDYEIFCKRILESSGWTVVNTSASADQGTDLVAEKGNVIAVIQCKFYSRPVGNKSVQEAYAAKTFQGADYAAVVSNSTFTRSAQQLAKTNNVYLLHHNSLPDFENVLRGSMPEGTLEASTDQPAAHQMIAANIAPSVTNHAAGQIAADISKSVVGSTRRGRMSTTEVVVKQVARSVSSQVGAQIGRAIVRGILGSLGGRR